MSRTGLTRRRLLQAGAAAAAGLGFYTWQWEPHWLEVVRLDLPVAHLPSSLVGRTLVQLSDIHVGPRVADAYLLDVFGQVSALAPDIVVYTGDLASFRDDGFYEQVERMYAAPPRGRLATLGTCGNHEYGPEWRHPEIADRLVGIAEAGGIRMLRNAIADVEGLQIVGLDDLWGQRFDGAAACLALDRSRAMLALSHNPDTVDLPAWTGFEGWILAGHTHGGQIKPPFLPPPVVPVRNRRYTAGTFDLAAGRTLYVSRGVGHLFQARFNVRPEVTVFTLQRA
ncbi:MAG: metallophosphoesterase [Acidobacteria bacterium]|nr:metallophosphoesterase [Acidobacteriota bacterium]